ncbi:MAG: hypothetical protein NTW29_17035 [Bacteroidetes bacterium]|nr:hypothetical protein [Bacteroidota bacterium]
MKKNKQQLGQFIFLCALIIFQSCATSAYDKLDTAINKAIRTKNDVDEAEWNTIAGIVGADSRHFPELTSADGRVDNVKLTRYIIDYANGHRRNSAAPVVFTPLTDKQKTARTHFKFYFENSYSMDGYVKGNTSFEAAITTLLVLVKNYAGQENLHINFINAKIYPGTGIDISNFAQQLEPGSPVYNVGGKDRTVSDLNRIYRTILDSTRSGVVSVLVSDCIYSLGKDGDTEGRLDIQKSLTMDAFLSRLKSTPISTICLKMTSEFNGKYWDYQNRPVNVADLKRPYYIWIIGPAGETEAFYNYLKPTQLESYNNSFVMTYTSDNPVPYYTFLKETGRIGHFTSDRSSSEFVHSIEDIGSDKGAFRFAVAVDLSKLSPDESYLLDKRNYQLTEGYILEKIEKAEREKVAKRDWVTIERSTATHVFTITLKSNSSVRDLSVTLRKQLPEWIESTNCIDDSDISANSGKTFGFAKLTEGILNAYNRVSDKQSAFFAITLNLKK